MMFANRPGSLRQEFSGSSGLLAFQRFQLQQTEERERRARKEEADNDAADLMDAVAVIASVDAVRSLQADIDIFDAATISALQQNEEELARVRAQLDEVFSKAYVLPDGRRVFKTEDGKRVFDEHGNELGAEAIDPAAIEDWRPRWETAKGMLERQEALLEQRAGLIGYQEKLDDARERLEAGDLTQDEYDQLRKGLIDDMPTSVRRQIPELAGEENEVTLQAAADIDFDITDDLVATTVAPLVPGR